MPIAVFVLCRLNPCAFCLQVGHSDKQAEQKACNNSRACVSAFPTQVQQGLVWVWADCSPQAYVESTMQGPALSPEYGRFEGKGANPNCLTCPTSYLYATAMFCASHCCADVCLATCIWPACSIMGAWHSPLYLLHKVALLTAMGAHLSTRQPKAHINACLVSWWHSEICFVVNESMTGTAATQPEQAHRNEFGIYT